MCPDSPKKVSIVLALGLPVKKQRPVDEDVWVHYYAVGIVTCLPFISHFSLNDGTLLISFFKDESDLCYNFALFFSLYLLDFSLP